MTRQGGDQPTRRLTVAELLAQHGKADAPSSGRRHRRRAAEEDADAELTTTAPQEIIDRIHAERPQEDWEPRSNGHSMANSLDADTRAVRPASGPPEPPRPVDPEPAPKAGKRAAKPQPPKPQVKPPPPPPKPQVKPEPPRASRTGSGYAPAVQPPPPGRRRPWENPQPPGDAIGDRLNGTRQGLTPPPAGKPPMTPPPPSKPQLKPVQPKLQPPPPPPPRRPMRPEPVTDEFPMVEDDVEYLDDDYVDEDYADGPYADDDLAAEPELLSGRRGAEPEAIAADGEFEEFEEFDEDAELAAAEADDRTVGQQWLAVGAQLALGVVGGAAVWLLFNWLWNFHAVVALGAALVVTAGLVWIVRNIRKAEDMQSTVLAVLVGLVVTVSPAALLLLSSR